jgi:hypothetical protein
MPALARRNDEPHVREHGLAEPHDGRLFEKLRL